MHKCNNDDEGDGTDDNCDVADAIVNDALDAFHYAMAMTNTNVGENVVNLHHNDDEFIANQHNLEHNLECNAENEMDNLDIDDDNYIGFNTANIAERCDNIDILLDIELESDEESDNNAHVSDISQNMVVNEQTEIDIINDISTNSLLNYKESKTITD